MTSPPHAEAFTKYNERLLARVSTVLEGGTLDPDLLALSLDGESAEQLRRLVPLSYRRQVGAFFTSGVNREAVASALTSLPFGRYLDPMCGAGDLLLAASKHLQVGQDLASTLKLWAPQLSGWDVHPEFVHATKLRLILAAAARSIQQPSKPAIYANRVHLPRIKAADATTQLLQNRLRNTVVIMNPPFGSTIASDACTWTEGLTSRAATFVEGVLDSAGPGCHIVAILPDVLRTGSRYDRWRRMIELQTRITSIRPLGLFDKHTNVDVFLLVAQPLNKAGKASAYGPSMPSVAWWDSSYTDDSQTVGDCFSIMVGPVVDNRDPHEGPNCPFAIARDLPPQGLADLPARTRRFSGRLFSPPFVLLRRTSKPSTNDKARAPGVLVKGKEMVAIDNHLIVAKPIDKRVSTCKRLLTILSDPQTTEFLNQRMRCRHLTVEAIRELPWTSG